MHNISNRKAWLDETTIVIWVPVHAWYLTTDAGCTKLPCAFTGTLQYDLPYKQAHKNFASLECVTWYIVLKKGVMLHVTNKLADQSLSVMENSKFVSNVQETILMWKGAICKCDLRMQQIDKKWLKNFTEIQAAQFNVVCMHHDSLFWPSWVHICKENTEGIVNLKGAPNPLHS